MIYWIVRVMIRVLFDLLVVWSVSGLEHFPQHGPALLVNNHLSLLDPPLMYIALPVKVRVFAADKWQHGIIGYLLRHVGSAIFVRRGEVDRHALQQALAALKRGEILGIAPEGTRSRTGTLQHGKPGVAFVASKANVPLIPVVVYGTEQGFWPLLRLHRPRMRVVIGEPFRLPDFNANGTGKKTDRLQIQTDYIMNRLAALLPAEYRGVYSGNLGKLKGIQENPEIIKVPSSSPKFP